MTLQNLWYSSEGPLIYDDANTYGIIDDPEVCREASRAPQHMVENEPTEYFHVVRLSGLTSKLTSTVAAFDSKLASVVATGGADAIARSLAYSAAERAHVAGDAAGYAQGSADFANSRLTSHGL
jgi:hypothetical protein